MTGDEALQRRVLEELEWDPKVDAARVGVAARGGVITLTGEVPSLVAKVAAETAARRVRGVRAIAQEIEVHPPGEPRRSDADIAERALRLLEWDLRVPHERVTVRVEDGWVTLAGEVDWHHQRAAAEGDVRRLSGVRGITDLIDLKPPSKVLDVRRRIEEAFMRNAALEAGRVSVQATDGKVLLGGRVETWHERHAAEEAAWSALGVTAVEDRIVVGP